MRFQVHSDELPYLYSMLAALPNGRLSRRNALLMRLEVLLSGATPQSETADIAAMPAQLSSPAQAPSPSAVARRSEPEWAQVGLDRADLDEIFGN
jgi:hypothetical protein